MKNLKVVLLSLLALAAAVTVGCGGGGSTITKLPFASNRQVTPATLLFLMNLDGTNVTPVANAPSNYWSPSISADLKKIVFIADVNVSIINSDGSGQTQLTTYTDDQTDNFSRAFHARISPNGKKIIYSAYDAGIYNVWSMNVDGTGKTNLTATLPTGMEGCYEGSFSANSHKITFACYNESGDAIYAADADGTHQSTVVPVASNVYIDIPMFSADGKKILFIGYNFPVGSSVRANTNKSYWSHSHAQRHVAPRGVSGNQGVFSVNLDGTGGALVVPDAGEAVVLNSSLYYDLYDSDLNHWQIWKANLDGTSAVKLSDGSSDDLLDIYGLE